jgi:F-type H+-transporting ATPase subunit epsilon
MADFLRSGATLLLQIVSAHGQVFKGRVRMVSVASVVGELGILPRHTPLMTFLKPGEARILTENGDEEYVYVSGGFLEIQPFQVTILADTAQRGDEIDAQAAEEARLAAEESMRTSVLYSDRDAAYAELLKAMAQLQVLEHARKKKRG